MGQKSPSSLVVTVIIALLALGVGLVLGYLLRPTTTIDPLRKIIGMDHDGGQGHLNVDGPDKAAALEMLRDCGELAREDPAISQHLIASDMEACRALTCDLPYPRTYVVYKLKHESIDLDGRLEEEAWTSAAWTDAFVDIRGRGFTVPGLETKVKMRYNDDFLFVGLFLEETQIWSNVTQHDGPVYQDNSVQILLDTRQSNINYKEITVNARGTISDLMMTKSYLDSGEPLSFWESEIISAVHIQGSINNPARNDKFWSIELAIPFGTLYQGSGASFNSSTPKHGETWRANFVRVQWPVERQGSVYVKKEGDKTEWWVWQSPRVINVHLPERWGLIQFQDAEVNRTKFETSDRWTVTNALLDTYSALKKFHTITGTYTDRKELLNLPPYIESGKCLAKVDIALDWSGFKVTAQSFGSNPEKGYTRTDHFVWFGEADMQYF